MAQAPSRASAWGTFANVPTASVSLWPSLESGDRSSKVPVKRCADKGGVDNT